MDEYFQRTKPGMMQLIIEDIRSEEDAQNVSDYFVKETIAPIETTSSSMATTAEGQM